MHVLSQPKVWFASRGWAIAFIAMVHAWGVVPLVTLILLAGLQGIPDQIYAAAAVDGANGWQQFRRLTVPLLRPALAVALTTGTILAIAIFDEIYVLNGTALNTRSVLIQVYKTTFVEADFGPRHGARVPARGRDGAVRRALRAGASEVDGMTTSAGMRILKAIAVIVIVAWSLGPIVLGVSTSVSTQREVNAIPSHWVPHQPTLKAYRALLNGSSGQSSGGTVTQGGEFVQAMTNSAELALASAALTLVVGRWPPTRSGGCASASAAPCSPCWWGRWSFPSSWS